MSMFGRAAAGFGAAVSSIASRYIDEELAANRAKLLADLQVQTHQRISEYDNSDTVQGQIRKNEAAKIGTTTEARATAERAATVAAGNDTGYQGVLDQAATREAERKARGEVAGSMITAPVKREQEAADAVSKAAATRQIMKDAASDSAFLKAEATVKLADPEIAARIAASRASAASSAASAEHSRAGTEAIRLGTEDKKKLDKLYDQASTLLSDTNIDDKKRAEELGKVERQIVLMKSKTGQGSTANAEKDQIETKYDEKGNVIERTVKSTRRPGSDDGRAPYADGTELRGKDGKVYVVQNGQPVLKEQGKAPAAAPTAPAARPVDPKMAPVQDARNAVLAAQQKVNAYGSAQRQRDPQGFARAQADLEAAKAALRDAEGAYADSLGPSMIPNMRPAP